MEDATDSADVFDAPDFVDASDAMDAAEDAAACLGPIVFQGQEASVPVDIIIALDSSGSMETELRQLENNFGTFWQVLDDGDIDARLFILSSVDVAPVPPAGAETRTRNIPVNVGSRNALSLMIDRFSDYGADLRPDAVTHLIVVTDDNSNLPWQSFQRTMIGLLLGHGFTFHAIASEQVMVNVANPFGACFRPRGAGSAVSPGIEYYEMAEATGGLQLSICAVDWTELVEELGNEVAVRIPLPCAYTLPPRTTPYTAEQLTVEALIAGPNLNISHVPDEASCTGAPEWWFFEASQRIQLCAATCDELELLDAEIEIVIECDES